MRRALAGLALVAAVAAGCGEEARPPDEEERLTRNEFVRRADAICAEYDRRLDALDPPEDVEDVARLAEEAFPIAQRGISELRKLRPPEDLERRVQAWLRLNDQNARNIHSLQEAAENGDTRRVQEIASEAAENERRADVLAAELGLDACARRDEER